MLNGMKGKTAAAVNEHNVPVAAAAAAGYNEGVNNMRGDGYDRRRRTDEVDRGFDRTVLRETKVENERRTSEEDSAFSARARRKKAQTKVIGDSIFAYFSTAVENISENIAPRL